MLLTAVIAAGVADRSVDLAFRRWKVARVKIGHQFLSTAGLIRITAVDQVDPDAITAVDAGRAGFADPAAVRAKLPTGSEPVFRIGLAWAGEDPRETLRGDVTLTDAELVALRGRLDRLDARSATGPWTRATLQLIDRSPGVVSTSLAAELGRERAAFKLDVRKLKALGLTQSLTVGYQLSARGREVLRRL